MVDEVILQWVYTDLHKLTAGVSSPLVLEVILLELAFLVQLLLDYVCQPPHNNTERKLSTQAV